MKNHIYLLIYVLVSAVSCTSQPNKIEEKETVFKVSKVSYDTVTAKVIQSIEYIAEPLKGLNNEQMASVAALLHITRVMAQSEYIDIDSKSNIGDYWDVLAKVCPPLPTFDIKYGNCIDEGISYASSMARCLEDDSKSELDCEKESAADAAATVVCRMKQLEDLPEIIRQIEGRDWAIDPQPWPINKRDIVSNK